MVTASTKPHHVVIVGAGFGGLETAFRLAGAPVTITLLDRRNHHLFQPLLYQVATASLADVRDRLADPLSLARAPRGRDLARDGHRRRRREQARAARRWRYTLPTTRWFSPPARGTPISATTNGSRSRRASRHWRMPRRCGGAFWSPSSGPSARPIRERAPALLTFVIIGAGPTGVELAGTIAELAQ